MARKTKQQAEETRLHLLDVAIRLFSQRGVSATSLADIAQAAGVTRGAIYWHFKNKLDLFNAIWQLSKSNINRVEERLQVQYPDDPLTVLREILVYVLEVTVRDERRRLMLEIMYHKCEYVGEMDSVRQARRELCMEDYQRIEQRLEHCIAAGQLPASLKRHRAAVLMRVYINGLLENWLLVPDNINLRQEARDYINLLFEMYQYCPTLQEIPPATAIVSPAQ